MDNVNVNDVVLEKKLEGYGVNDDDFQCSSDILVTITLAEYRKLVGTVAVADYKYSKLQSEKWDLEKKCSSLEDQNKALLNERLQTIKMSVETIGNVPEYKP